MAEVRLHAYALSSKVGWHIGVEVYGREYYFDGYPKYKGVLSCHPGTWAGKASERTSLGLVDKTARQVKEVLRQLRRNEYSTRGFAKTYSLLFHNCQDFAESFCHHLGCLPVPSKYTRLRDSLRLRPSMLRDVFGGAGPSGNTVTARLKGVPRGWGVRVYAYAAGDTWHAVSYWSEWLDGGAKRVVSAGQLPHEAFCVCVHDGRGKCLTGDHWCLAGDVLDISYHGRWSIAHRRAGRLLDSRRSES